MHSRAAQECLYLTGVANRLLGNGNNEEVVYFLSHDRRVELSLSESSPVNLATDALKLQGGEAWQLSQSDKVYQRRCIRRILCGLTSSEVLSVILGSKSCISRQMDLTE
jgi:hypothetical protein